MKWFNNLRVQNKFLVVASIVIPFLIGLGVIGIWGVSDINEVLQEAQNNQIPSIYYLGQSAKATELVRIANRQALLDTDPAKIQEDVGQARNNITNARKFWDIYIKLPATVEEQTLWPQFEEEWNLWTGETEEILKLVLGGTTESRQKALTALAQASTHSDKLAEIMDNLTSINYKATGTQAKAAKDTFNTVITLIVIAILLVTTVTITLGLMLVRSISNPLNKLRDATRAVAEGDLTVKVELNTKDEVGQLAAAFNTMTLNLNELNREITRAGQELNSASAELLALVNQQTAGASEQSAAIHQTTSTVNEVKATIEQTNQRARSMSDTATRFVNVAEEGQLAVTETVGGMNLIKEQVETIAENILALSEQTQQIGEIIATVNDIAEQSNLLVLNAAVEAARAGEHGRGFAVVANEVRALAERSKQATSQVRTILSDIQKATNSVVMVTEEGTKGVDHGVKLVDRAGLTIRQLSGVIQENLASTQQIIAVVQQQNVGVEQVAQSMTNINEVTNQNVSASRQLQQSVESMNRLAGRFSELTGRFQLAEYTINGNGLRGAARADSWLSQN
jgi:methyl-accepting chemotaxis protein